MERTQLTKLPIQLPNRRFAVDLLRRRHRTYLVEALVQPAPLEGPRCDGPLLSVIGPSPHKRSRGGRQATKRISLRQARTMMDGLAFAREIGTPLNTHLIIHWGGTLAGDDPDGELFAKLRYLLDKRFRRKYGIELTAIWVRERHRNKRTRRSSEVTHSHVLLHLPRQHRRTARQDVEELVAFVAGKMLDDRTVELTFPANCDGKYLLKGGTPAVWEAFYLPHKWRSRPRRGCDRRQAVRLHSEHWSSSSSAAQKREGSRLTCQDHVSEFVLRKDSSSI